MPAINKTWYPRTDKYNQLFADSERHNERSDCTVVAIAIVTGKSYTQSWDALAAAGRQPRCGATRDKQRKALAALGYKARRVQPDYFINQYPEVHKRQLKNVTSHHPDRFPHVFQNGKVYMMFNRKHVAALVDGKLHDWTRGTRKKIVEIWEITPA